jgi:hypothetical protein
VALTLFGLLAVQTDTIADSSANGGVHVTAVSAEPNDLRWDLVKAFKFDWTSAELSAKVTKGDDPNAPVRTLSVSVKLDILDMTRLVIVDMNSIGIREVLDQDGNATQYQPVQSDQTRRYDHLNWHWDQGGTWLGLPLQPLNVMFRLTSNPKQPLPSSISQLTGYVYAIYADDVIKVDIPFDPDYGWHEAKVVPDLMLCVDLLTPPCPGPLQYVNLLPTSMDSRRFNLHRPKTPVPLYKYETWVKSKKGGPMMGLFDPATWYPRSLFPLGDYAIVRTELFDSKRNIADQFFTQWIVGNPSGDTGARCSGQKEQASGDTYDSIRHVIAVHPVEVKVPFVLKNIPIPKLRSTAN